MDAALKKVNELEAAVAESKGKKRDAEQGDLRVTSTIEHLQKVYDNLYSMDDINAVKIATRDARFDIWSLKSVDIFFDTKPTTNQIIKKFDDLQVTSDNLQLQQLWHHYIVGYFLERASGILTVTAYMSFQQAIARHMSSSTINYHRSLYQLVNEFPRFLASRLPYSDLAKKAREYREALRVEVKDELGQVPQKPNDNNKDALYWKFKEPLIRGKSIVDFLYDD